MGSLFGYPEQPGEINLTRPEWDTFPAAHKCCFCSVEYTGGASMLHTKTFRCFLRSLVSKCSLDTFPPGSPHVPLGDPKWGRGPGSDPNIWVQNDQMNTGIEKDKIKAQNEKGICLETKVLFEAHPHAPNNAVTLVWAISVHLLAQMDTDLCQSLHKGRGGGGSRLSKCHAQPSKTKG